MKNKNKFSLVQMMLIIAMVALLAAIALPQLHAQTWPSTNAATQTITGGPALYNDATTSPLQPSVTLANMRASGTLIGYLNPGAITNGNGSTITFSTNIFTQPPIVVATSSVTNIPVAVTAVTTTNFTISVLGTNGVKVYWEAVGY